VIGPVLSARRRQAADHFQGTTWWRMMLGMVDIGDLSDAERQVWDAFPTGRLVDWGTGNAEDDDPVGGADWGLDRQVRAEVLAALLSGAVEVEPGQVGEICLDRARIIGKLDLPGATFKHRMRLNACHVADGIDLSEATIRTLHLRGCHVGMIRLSGTKIDGVFDLEGAHLDGKDGIALTANRLTVTGAMGCHELQAGGEIQLVSASIGELNFGGAHLDGKDGVAMNADGLTVTGTMFCNEGFQAEGQIRLVSASIGGELDFRGAHLDSWFGLALLAQGITVGGAMLCDKGFRAEGQINLLGASIGGPLDFRGAHLDGKGEEALIADGLTVTASMFCHQGFQAVGGISLGLASIGSQLGFQGAQLDGRGGRALTADGLTVTAGMFCDKGFQAEGEVRLAGASIGGLLDLGGAHLHGVNGPALIAWEITVAGSMLCGAGFQAEGQINLAGASIRDLYFGDAYLDGKGHDALIADGSLRRFRPTPLVGEF
jgi:hypothetical protein